MAGSSRRSPTALESELFNEPRSFSFFQAIRLLRLFASDVREKRPSIRMRPELSQAFPAADVAANNKGDDEDADYRMDLSFLGLYGPSSPLPTFYTEDLLDEQSQEESVTRDFLDIFNQRIYELFFDCWSKYRNFMRVAEEHDDWARERLFSLLGLGEKELRDMIPESFQLMRYIGLFSQHPRSALGLKTLLQDALKTDVLDIEPCILRWVPIPEEQQVKLGEQSSDLGRTTLVGSVVEDRMGKFRIHIGPLKKRSFQEFMPGMPKHELMVSLVRLYITDPLEYDLNLILKPGEAQKACLGGAQWSAIGLDTWIFSQESLGEVRVGFQPEALQS